MDLLAAIKREERGSCLQPPERRFQRQQNCGGQDSGPRKAKRRSLPDRALESGEYQISESRSENRMKIEIVHCPT